jgi:hypothetical protein
VAGRREDAGRAGAGDGARRPLAAALGLERGCGNGDGEPGAGGGCGLGGGGEVR